jgi:hypothetical protein
MNQATGASTVLVYDPHHRLISRTDIDPDKTVGTNGPLAAPVTTFVYNVRAR